MGYQNREIEIKLLCHGESLRNIRDILGALSGGVLPRSGVSLDYYWTTPPNGVSLVDFARIRTGVDRVYQITVKGKDQGTNLDRIEVDIESTSPLGTLHRFLEVQYGRPAGVVEKIYDEYWMKDHEVLSCYRVTLPPFSPVVVEIETTNHSRLLQLEAQVLARFAEEGIVCERAPGSLYEMLLAPQQGEKK